MKADNLYNAEAECRRFLNTCAKLKAAAKEDKYALDHSKQAAAVRRASMDLTRALADLRGIS